MRRIWRARGTGQRRQTDIVGEGKLILLEEKENGEEDRFFCRGNERDRSRDGRGVDCRRLEAEEEWRRPWGEEAERAKDREIARGKRVCSACNIWKGFVRGREYHYVLRGVRARPIVDLHLAISTFSFFIHIYINSFFNKFLFPSAGLYEVVDVNYL